MTNNIVLGILAHVDAGKTTLSESMLYTAGSIRNMGRVDNGNAFLDTDLMEKERGITIFSKQAVLEMQGQTYTLLDTPGHVDFSAEAERTLQVLDYAILVVSAADGVQGHTATLWNLLARYQVPVFIFVNKMDQSGADKSRILKDLNTHLSDACIDFDQDEEELMDALAMCSEEAMESYLEEGTVHEDRILDMIRKRQLFPCFFGSALRVTGISEFMDALHRLTRPGEYGEAFGARVYKIARDEQDNRLTFMKITGGSLSVRELVGSEKVSQLRVYNGIKYEAVPVAESGMICAAVGLTQTAAGDGLGCEEEKQLPVLEPVLTYRVLLQPELDPVKAMHMLRTIEEEEPMLHVIWEEELQEIHVRLMGEIQTEILRRQMLDRFGAIMDFGEGGILYKETISNETEGVGHFEPLRHYAEVHLRLEPGPVGSGLVFDSACSVNELERNWQRLILTHLEEKVHKGVLTGAPITDMKITLIAGKAHKKHTEGGDFRQATYRAVRQGLMKATSVILEPWYDFRLEIPGLQIGRAMSDLEMRSARFELESSTDELCVIKGRGPVSTLRSYARDLAAYTSGKGRFFCSNAGYYPCHDQEAVWEQAGYDPCSDLTNSPDSVFCVHGAGYVVPWYEVESYMHLEGSDSNEDWESHFDERDQVISQAQTENYKRQAQARKEAARDDGLSSGLRASMAMDKELEAIFTRTYGEIRPKVHDTTQTFGKPKEKEYVYKEARKKPVLEHFLLVDGYNIIFAWKTLHDLAVHDMAAARDQLIGILSNYQGFTDQHIILVFDAYKVEGFKGEILRWQNIDIVFTKEAETADQYIEKTAHVLGKRYRVTVATSDGTEQVIIRSQGCLLMSARELEEEIGRVKKQIRDEHLAQQPKSRVLLFDHLSPEQLEAIAKLAKEEDS